MASATGFSTPLAMTRYWYGSPASFLAVSTSSTVSAVVPLFSRLAISSAAVCSWASVAPALTEDDGSQMIFHTVLDFASTLPLALKMEPRAAGSTVSLSCCATASVRYSSASRSCKAYSW